MKSIIRTVSVATALGLSLVLLLPGSSPAARAAGVKRIVHDPADPSSCPGATDPTIMSAVAAVGPGPGTITVCSGTYAEAVIIDGVTNVKLIGKPGASIIPQTDPYDGVMIQVTNSTNVTVQGFVLNGANRFDASLLNGGIWYVYSTGIITRNYLVGIRKAIPNSACVGAGITVTNAPAAVKISGNTIYDFGCYGIVIGTAAAPVMVQHNMLWTTAAYGAEPVGILYYKGAGGSITSNSINSDWRPGMSNVTNGISVNETPNLKVSGNQVNHFTYGIRAQVNHVLLDMDKLTISANRINDVKTGISIFVGAMSGLPDPSSDNDKITSNTFSSPTFMGEYAIQLSAVVVSGSGTPSLTNTTISGNKQSGFLQMLQDDSGGVTHYASSNKTIPPPTGF